jgi:hypothetical protein
MSAPEVIAVAVLAASIVLVAQVPARVPPLLAVAAAAAQALIAFGVVSLRVKAVPLDLVLGSLLLVGGGLSYASAAAKHAVAAAAIVAFVGALQVIAALRLF